LLNREIPLKRKITKGKINVEREKVIKHHKHAVSGMFMVLGVEHENTQGVFIFKGGGTEAPRGAGLVGREGCKRPRHTKNMPMWAHFTCLVAAGAGEAARKAPNTKMCPCRRAFMLGFKGGAEEALEAPSMFRWRDRYPHLQNT